MKNENSFTMSIDGVFCQYGIFAAGRVENGHLKVGDKIDVIGNNAILKNVCASLAKYHPHDKKQKTSVKEVHTGDYVCIGLLEGSKLQIRIGMKIISSE